MNELDLPNHYDDLDLIYNEIWTSLIRGKKDSKSEFHQCYVSTYSDDYPSLRTVVLRHANKDNLTISFHTCLLYTSPSPRDGLLSRMPSSA